MGAKKKRQEGPSWQEQQRQPVVAAAINNDSISPQITSSISLSATSDTFTNATRSETSGGINRESAKYPSQCCDDGDDNTTREDVPLKHITDELRRRLLKRPGNHQESLCGRSLLSFNYFSSCFTNLFTYYLSSVVFKGLLSSKSNSSNGKYYNKGNVTLARLLLFVIIASCSVFVDPVDGVCVWQGGGGFRVACGFRQSGLFRIRSIGGIKGYVGAGFTIGDEGGFKDSLTNTEPQQSGAYVIPNNVHSQRSLPSAQNGIIGQYSQIHEHSVPIPTGNPASQKHQKLQYLENIQQQMESDQQSLHHMASDQQTQKMLEQQLHLQGGVIPQSPTPTAKVKRAGTGGLTKRATLWKWPSIFGRGKNGKNGNKKKPNHHNGPPPHANRRGGPPHKNKPHGKNGRPLRRGDRRGPFPPNANNNQQRPSPPVNPSESFINQMQNPFAHLQDNFVGTHSQESRRIHNFQQGQERPGSQSFNNNNNNNGQNQFPPPPTMPDQNFFQPQAPFSGEHSGQVPQQQMMPPTGPNIPAPLPQFKKIPNNNEPISQNDDYYDDAPGDDQQQYAEEQKPPQPPIDRMMNNVDDDSLNGPPEPPPDFFNSNGHVSLERQFNDYEADPAGLKMLKRTENFGTIYHLINPDGSPVNMQFEKQPIVPPGIELSSQQQIDLVDELASVLPPPNTAEMSGGGGGTGELMDSQLATAVYDPNVFPDIYFTTTEKQFMKQQKEHQDLLQMLSGELGAPSGAAGGGAYSLSQELPDSSLFGNNNIKRILGISSSSVEKTGGVGRSGSGEGGGASVQQVHRGRKKTGVVLRSNEVLSSAGDQQAMPPRRKLRRRKKYRMNHQAGNQVDTSEHETNGADATPASTLPKRRRKGRRKKKYRLHTMSPHNKNNGDGIASSTERMGLGLGEQASSEMKTETPIPDPLTTTPVPQKSGILLAPTASSGDILKINGKNNKTSDNKGKTSFSLPSSSEDVKTSSVDRILLTGPSAENKIDTSAAALASTIKTSEESTTNVPMSFSTFGYYDALRNKQKNDQDADYDSLSGPSGPGGFFRAGYDPRFPPDHEVNRGHNMTKFIRPRVKGSKDESSGDTANGPFILYDMTGTRNHSRFSSKFHKETSPFTLDGEVKNGEPNRIGDMQNPHPFFTNSNLHGNNQQNGQDDGMFLKFDSAEWAAGKKKSSQFKKDHRTSDPFTNHYNRTSLSSGFYGSGASKEFRPSVEIPWDKSYTTPPTTTTSSIYPIYGSGGSKSSGSLEHGIFGPTMETFGLPKPASTPMSSSGEKQQRKLHQNMFGGSSADISDLGNWAAPNFWGNVQDTDRYSPSVDFDVNSNKRLMDFGDPNGLKEMQPVDLSSPTPLPVPAPSVSQSTMEDILDAGPGYFLSPSTPGERWGKQRKRKQKPTAPTTPAPAAAFVMSTMASTAALPSSTSAAPSKWLAVMSNEVDLPPEYYDNISMLPPGTSATSVETELIRSKGGKGKKKGVEIKFKSGEQQDPEEEAQNENNTANAASAHFDILGGFPSGASGFPGVMMHNFESDTGYGFGEVGDSGVKDSIPTTPPPPPPPPPGFPHVHIPPAPGSDISYFPIVNSDNRVDPYAEVHQSSGTALAQFQHPPSRSKNNNKKSNQGPVFTGRHENNNNSGRRDFVPSAEDLGPLPPSPPPGRNGGPLPIHKDNPFKMFEKQNAPVSTSNFGFVSAKHELKEMEDQISKFSDIPEVFSRRSSEEKMGGSRVHAPNMDEAHPEFHGPPAPPPSSIMNIPGFVTIPLPNMDEGAQQHQNEENPLPYIGFPLDIRDPEKTHLSGPPAGLEGYAPSMPPSMPPSGMEGETSGNDLPARPPPGMLKDPEDTNWNFRPLDHNDVNDIGPPPNNIRTGDHPHSPPPHGRPRPPIDSEEEFRRHPHDRPPPHLRDGPLGRPPPGHDRPPHLRNGPPGSPPHIRDGPPPHIRDGHAGPPPHLRDGPSGPPHLRESHPGPPPHLRDSHSGPPPHIRDSHPGPPPHLRDGPPGPPHRENHPGPPPHLRDGPPYRENHPGAPPHLRDGPPGPPHRENHPGPPPHLRDGPPGPPHRENHPGGPPPHLRDGPLHRENHPGPPPHLRDGPPHRENHPGPPPHLRDGPPGPPHRENHPGGPPSHLRDGPPHRENHPGGPPSHLRDGPPHRENHPGGPPPHLRDGPPHHMRDSPPGRPPHIRDGPPGHPPGHAPHNREDSPAHPPRDGRTGPPPHIRGDGPPGPPHLRDGTAPALLRPPPPLRDDRERSHAPHERPPPMREEHPSMRPPPPIRENHPPAMREEHLLRPPPPPMREEHPSRQPPSRDDHHQRPPPPHREERPPPGRPHDLPPRGPPSGHHETERRPPPREFAPPREEGPPRHHHPDDHFRDGPPHHRPDHHKHPPPPRPNGPPGGLHHPKDEPHRFDQERRNNFLDDHKPIDHHGDHSSFKSWQDEKNRNRERPQLNVPPTPHGMPDFLDLQKVPKNRNDRPHKNHPPKSQKEYHNPFQQKPPHKKPPPGSQSKIPQQVFKPPPPPPPPKSANPNNNFFSNILHTGPFGNKLAPNKHSPPPPPPRQQQLPPVIHGPNSRPQHHSPNHPPPRKPPVPLGPDPFSGIPFHEPPRPPPRDMPPNNPNNYINTYNDRYEPPAAPQHPHGMEDPNHKLHLKPEPLPSLHPGQQHVGSGLPFLPFPAAGPGGASFETSMVDLDQEPNAHLLPPTLHPHQDDQVRHLQKQHTPPKQTPRPVYQPKPLAKPSAKADEKHKVMEAFETLNKANYDVIQSVAADQYGQNFIDKIKTKSNMISDDRPSMTKPLLPPVANTTTSVPLMNMFAAFNSKQASLQDENAKLAELLKMINSNSKSSPPTTAHAQPIAAASTMGANPSHGNAVDPLSSLLQKLSNPAVVTTPPTTTTSTTQRPIPENPGLVSLTSLNPGSNHHDIKHLQAQIAKAIIAKAHRKSSQPESLEKPHYQPVHINAPTNESPLAVLQQLAQNRQSTIEQQANSKNYTASQIETLKKLIALNNLEQKMAPSSSQVTSTTTENPLKKLQALLPAALQVAKQQQQQQQQQQNMLPSNTISRKMLDSTTANSLAHHHNNQLLQNPDPTILALKAIAMSKSHGINPQPSISLPQQVKPTEPSSQPIAVDLSAILSPSPPVVEASRKRRLTNVRNAPKSFYPANATQGFEDFSGPLISEFQCDEQSFFPGLYADTELGCRVFHLCAKTESGYMMKSFRCPKETVFDQEVLRCNWNLFVECPTSKNKYHFNKYLSQSFQFLKILGEFSANSQKG